jgi:tetrahydromethanopterin S-methyltransferase subunit G
MFGLPMQIVGPVIGFAAIIFSVVAGVVTVRLATSKIKQYEQRARVVESPEHDRVLEDVQSRLGELEQLTQRLGELEERVDFAERLLAQPREGQRLGPPQG